MMKANSKNAKAIFFIITNLRKAGDNKQILIV